MTPDQSHDKELIAQAARFKELRGLNNAQFGAKVGYSETVIFRWLKEEYLGDVVMLEKKVRDALRQAEQREQRADGLFDSHATRTVRALAKELKRNHWMGAGYGDAGIGKTCGAHKALLQDLSAIFITIVCYRRDKASLMRVLWNEIGEARDNGSNVPMAERLHNYLTGSNRIVIVDQAHVLNKLGRQFFCDLHDQTGVAILFLGNPEMFRDWREQEQQFSRLRLVEKITLQPATTERLDRAVHTTALAAEEMLHKLLPEAKADPVAWECLAERSRKAAGGRGHLRTLETVLIGARTHRERLKCSWADAFDAALETTAGQFCDS